MSPKVSIITITYNAGEFLEKTLLSVLNQSSSDLEYILVDGASTDNTTTIIRKYEDLVSKARFAIGSDQFRWISEADQGLYDAMNKGLNMARGEFVWFINAGDKIYDNNSLELIVSKLMDYPQSDVLKGQSLIIDQYDKALGESIKLLPQTEQKKPLRGLVCLPSVYLVRRSLLRILICNTAYGRLRLGLQSPVLSVQNNYIDHYIPVFGLGLSPNSVRSPCWKRFRIMRRLLDFCNTGSHF
jgi:glycosyltransferase involved in cell wall biosynthesis